MWSFLGGRGSSVPKGIHITLNPSLSNNCSHKLLHQIKNQLNMAASINYALWLAEISHLLRNHICERMLHCRNVPCVIPYEVWVLFVNHIFKKAAIIGKSLFNDPMRKTFSQKLESCWHNCIWLSLGGPLNRLYFLCWS